MKKVNKKNLLIVKKTTTKLLNKDVEKLDKLNNNVGKSNKDNKNLEDSIGSHLRMTLYRLYRTIETTLSRNTIIINHALPLIKTPTPLNSSILTIISINK